MLMHFELLQGMHSDINGKLFSTLIYNDQGEVIGKRRPVIESESDLVKNFGTMKFRRITADEYNILLQADAEALGETEETPSAPSDSAVSEAAKKGAAGLQHADVTESFPKAKAANLKVMKGSNAEYYVLDGETNQQLSEEGKLKSKVQVHTFIKQYMEQ